MANKDRNKRSVRQARAAERERVAEAQAIATTSSSSKVARKQAKEAEKSKKEVKKTGFVANMRRYFSDVRTELHRVTWPSRQELTNWSVAVVIALAIFGVCVWAVDTGFVALLVGFTGLRG